MFRATSRWTDVFKAYNPRQARYPKGHPQGGQWKTSGHGILADMVPANSIIQFSGDTLRTELRAGYNAIGQAHNLPKSFPVVRILASFPKGDKDDAIYHPGFRSISINPSVELIKKQGVFTHEFGHHLYEAGSLATRALFAKVRKTDTYQTWQALGKLAEAGKAQLRIGDTVVSGNWVKYINQRTEWFARIYSQYVAVRSDSSVLRVYVSNEQKKSIWGMLTSDEFSSVLGAFDDLFEASGN